MNIPLEKILGMVFKRSPAVNLSSYADDIKTFNVLFALDGQRAVQTIAEQDAFNPDELANIINSLYSQGLVEPVMIAEVTRGRVKKILDAIIEKPSHGISAMAKSIRIKLALRGVDPYSLTPHTIDDPVLIKKLLKLAKVYGVHVSTQSNRSTGRTKLILDSIITQRSGGDPKIAKVIKTKLMLKGINPDAYSLDSMDDPAIVQRLMDLAQKLGVKIPTAKAFSGDQIDRMF